MVVGTDTGVTMMTSSGTTLWSYIHNSPLYHSSCGVAIDAAGVVHVITQFGSIYQVTNSDVIGSSSVPPHHSGSSTKGKNAKPSNSSTRTASHGVNSQPSTSMSAAAQTSSSSS
jgi:hypothetical protein